MPSYRVRWEIDIFEVDSPREAAERAREIQLNRASIANVFEVTTHEKNDAGFFEFTEVDLEENSLDT